MWSSLTLSGYSVSPVLYPGCSLRHPDCFQAQTVKTSHCGSSPGGPFPLEAPRPEIAALEPGNEPHPLLARPLPAGTEKKKKCCHSCTLCTNVCTSVLENTFLPELFTFMSGIFFILPFLMSSGPNCRLDYPGLSAKNMLCFTCWYFSVLPSKCFRKHNLCCLECSKY